jgi:two-component system, OmpR family, copper resistance phosphate regulon response regulator CusR
MNMRILVVEDDAAISDFLVRGLKEEGYAVAHAADGDAGRHRLQSESWDIVLLDCWLPKTDGMTVLRQFRKRDATTPVLVLTARDTVADRVEGLDSGADDYLCKPFAFVELLARIRSLTRRQRHRDDTSLVYSDIHLDLVSQRATRCGIWLELTSKEQSLLGFFLRHPCSVLTRNCIYENVWNEPYDGESNTLEVHVMELRRKLEAHGPRLIFTLRGRGYMLSDSPRADLERA